MSNNDLLLGADTVYPFCYNPLLLCPIPRLQGRQAIGIDSEPLFYGFDLWTAYELSWLDPKGKPMVAIADISMPCDTKNLVESKSLKLYLNSLNQTTYSSVQEVAATLERDISECVQGSVLVDIHTTDSYRHQALRLHQGRELVTESFFSHLLKTNCPVTGQPDWASIMVRYTGWPIDSEGLLKYIVSYRHHQDFHEQCVERIFTEINELCQPDELEVYARYTRRGGLDINPYRSSKKLSPPKLRLSRQ